MDSVKSVLRIIEAIATSPEIGVSDLSRQLKQPKTTVQRGLMTKEGGRQAMDHYFHQIARPGPEAPSESKGPWDYYKHLGTVSGEDAWRPAAESECPLLKKS